MASGVRRAAIVRSGQSGRIAKARIAKVPRARAAASRRVDRAARVTGRRAIALMLRVMAKAAVRAGARASRAFRARVPVAGKVAAVAAVAMAP